MPHRTNLDPRDLSIRPLSEYCDRLPSRVRGRSLNRATLWRWALRGRRDGRVLRTLIICSGRFTCDAWVVEFTEPGAEMPPHHGQRRGMDPDERERIARRLGSKPPAQGHEVGP